MNLDQLRNMTRVACADGGRFEKILFDVLVRILSRVSAQVCDYHTKCLNFSLSSLRRKYIFTNMNSKYLAVFWLF